MVSDFVIPVTGLMAEEEQQVALDEEIAV